MKDKFQRSVAYDVQIQETRQRNGSLLTVACERKWWIAEVTPIAKAKDLPSSHPCAARSIQPLSLCDKGHSRGFPDFKR